jgi:hypothetical protein
MRLGMTANDTFQIAHTLIPFNGPLELAVPFIQQCVLCAMAGSNVMESNMQGIIDAPLTMSGVIKELQVLKDKFKNEDDEEGA